MDLKVCWLLLRSSFSRKNKQLDHLAYKATEKARLLATERIDEQRGFLFLQCLRDSTLAAYVDNKGKRLQISFELQFLWGLFQEHVKNYDLPTDEQSRVKIHLVDWLVSLHGYQFREAALEVSKIENFYNKCDPLFEVISDLGRRAYEKPNQASMFIVYKELMDQERSV